LVQLKQPAEAVELLQKALTLDPSHALSHESLWRALLAAGRHVEALAALRTACRALPQNCTLKQNLVFFLATAPQVDRTALQDALAGIQECCTSQPDDPENFNALGLAYAAAGDFPHAIEHAQHALALAQAQNKGELAARINTFLEAYRAGRRP
jgi:tetratricopeptide (TPR) repeat protein